MLKLIGTSVVALAVTLVSMQEASAWSNVKFGIGLNFEWQAANNSIGKHLWRSGQVPGYGHMPAAPYYGGHDFYAPAPTAIEVGAAPMNYSDVTPAYYAPSYSYPAPVYGYGQ